jgi:hypothetical protein
MAPTQKCEVDEMQLSIGSHWTDSQGREFVLDTVEENGTETWVSYTRVEDCTSYRCFAEAFINRFQRIENDSRS